MERMQTLISQTQEFKCIHIIREANWVADSLCKHIHNLTRPQLFYNCQELPKEAKAYYHRELLEMPSFRRKKTKKIKETP